MNGDGGFGNFHLKEGSLWPFIGSHVSGCSIDGGSALPVHEAPTSTPLELTLIRAPVWSACPPDPYCSAKSDVGFIAQNPQSSPETTGETESPQGKASPTVPRPGRLQPGAPCPHRAVLPPLRNHN